VTEVIRRGEVFLVNLDPVVGHEIGRSRPAVVVQNDVGNRFSPTTIVVAITEYSAKKATYPICVTLKAGEGGLEKKSIANTAQLRTIDRKRLAKRPLGRVSDVTLGEIDEALITSLGLERPAL
jgi:mRNA interferase MazF